MRVDEVLHRNYVHTNLSTTNRIVGDRMKGIDEEQCLNTGLPKSWCSHCRRKTLTDEEQEKADLDTLMRRLEKL